MLHRSGLTQGWPCTLILLILTSIVTVHTHAAVPSLGEIEQQLEKLDPDDTTTETEALRETYQQTRNAISELEQYRSRIAQLNSQIENQPEKLATLREDLQSEPEPIKRSDTASPEELEQQITQTKAELVQLGQTRQQLEEAIRSNDTRLVELRAQLAALKQDELVPSLSPDLSSPLKKARQDLLDAQAELKAARIQALELELLALPGESELNQLRLTQTRRQIEQLSTAQEEMQQALAVARRSNLEQALSDLGPEPDALPSPLADISQRNRQTSDSLRHLLAEISAGNETLTRLENQITQISERSRLIRQQLELDIPQLSTELRRFIRQLTRPLDSDATRSSINELRLANLATNRQILSAEQARSNPPSSLAVFGAATHEQYQSLLDTRIRLLNQLHHSRQQLINLRAQILASQQQINEQLRQARTLVNQQLLWQPSVPAIDTDLPGNLLQGLTHLHQRWKSLGSGASLLSHNHRLWLALLIFTLLAGVAIALRRYVRHHRAQWHAEIGRVTQDRFVRSLVLLAAPVVIASPVPVFALLLQTNLNPAYPLYDTLTLLLLTFGGLTFIQQCFHGWLSTPHGLLHAHLGLPHPLCQALNRELHLLSLLSLPLLAGLYISDGLEEPELLASGGRLLFLLLTLLLVRFWWVMWKNHTPINQLTGNTQGWRDARLWIGLMLAFNVAMFVLGLAGYLLSALYMIMLLALVILQLALAFICYRLGLRWLMMEERRLALEQALEKRAEQRAAREEGVNESSELEENFYDLETLSEQSQTLLKVAVAGGFALLIWITLGDYLPSLNILDRIPLWSVYQGGADAGQLRSVTLADVLTGVLTLALSLLAAYNLPGLLELLVLRHLRLSAGSGFAITTLLKYSLILVGVMAGIGQFGLEWSKLQWLVAALGVGLGFGLQEIVANFVSGIILLFEKPIRIGDTVTIGDVTGNVSRIQIRATTLVDWDMKEVVIPNKTFITERLINWSLTDSTTRVVLQVGVAYGSDTQKVKALLLEAAAANPDVLDEPEPSAYFRAFGDSTLNFDLRVYVSRMEDRIPVTDSLNHTIDRLFRQAGIEIAFPQLDVHLFRAPPKKPPSSGPEDD
ncbi:MAG: hypothetical protein CMI01_04135 [Oceanospirillaceae bacterium]|nr:hypothetical protein [Oceanospirillaceae bacterium]